MKILNSKYNCYLLSFLVIPTFLFSQTSLETSAFSTTGGIAQNANVTLIGIMGQSSPPGDVNSGSVTLSGGFINTIGDFGDIDIQPPVVQHSRIASAPLNGAIAVSADVTDNESVATVTLHYRQGGQPAFTEAAMMLSGGDTWQGVIPGSSVTDRGVEYFISAKDTNGNEALSPAAATGFFATRVSVPAPGIAKASAQPSERYQLVSLPIEVTNTSPLTVFSELGPYDITKWRLWDTLTNQSPSDTNANKPYLEFNNNNFSIQEGHAYWLAVRRSDFVVKSGASVTVNTSQDFVLPVHQRWNFVATPFNFSIPLSNVRLASGAALDILSFGGSQFIPLSSSLRPFQGYALFVDADDQLIITPRSFSSSINKPGNESDWSIRILAQCGEALDTFNFAGVALGASLGWDEMDRPEPPVIGEYVSLYFPHREWERLSYSFRTDVQPPDSDGHVWEFVVRSNIRERISLGFENLEQVPLNFDILLIDEALSVRKNLRRDPGYSFVGAGERNLKRFKLMVGRSDFLDSAKDEDLFIPASYELGQNYPNPFNPSTTIHYGLPKDGHVSLTIFNLLGEAIVTLVDDEYQHEGYHTVIWDGRDELGDVVASGIYIYRMQVGGFGATKKLTFIK